MVEDSAVGLSGVFAASRLGANRILTLNRHQNRQKLARVFDATDIVEQRGERATKAIMALTHGIGADAVLECVGTGRRSMTTVGVIARPGTVANYVGASHGVEVPLETMLYRNLGPRHYRQFACMI